MSAMYWIIAVSSKVCGRATHTAPTERKACIAEEGERVGLRAANVGAVCGVWAILAILAILAGSPGVRRCV